MNTVAQLLDSKGHIVHSIDADDSVLNAIKQMAKLGIGALVVMENDVMVGIISERDYARKVILDGKSSRDTRVKDIMTGNTVCARPNQTVEECMAVITEKRVRHLPVLENNKVIGMISIGDLVKSIIAEQQFIIEQLEHYISG